MYYKIRNQINLITTSRDHPKKILRNKPSACAAATAPPPSAGDFSAFLSFAEARAFGSRRAFGSSTDLRAVLSWRSEEVRLSFADARAWFAPRD